MSVGVSLVQESLNAASNFILSRQVGLRGYQGSHLRSTRHQETLRTLALTPSDQKTRLNFLLSASTTLKKKTGGRRGTRGVTLQG